jgi:hypothetical protein
MLDDDKQIEAFGILSARGVVTPQPIIVCGEIVTLAGQLVQTITPLLVAGTLYPASITGYTAKIAGYISHATQAGSAAEAFSKALEPYITPSELLQMKIGWECYAKGNRLNPPPTFPLVAALNDRVTTQALRAALGAVQTADLVKAMVSINTVLAVPPAPAEEAAAPVPALSAKQIEDLRLAVVARDVVFSSVSNNVALTTNYTNPVNRATGTATKSLSNAVAITLTVGLATDPVMSQAISAIMPSGVLDALKED